MQEGRSLTNHFFNRAMIAAGLSWYIVRLVNTDHLVYYIAPRMQSYVRYSAIVLGMFAAYLAYQGLVSMFKPKVACHCEQEPPRSLWRNFFSYGLLCLPLLLGFCMPDSVMGSAMAATKGVSLKGTAMVRTLPASAAPSSTPAPTSTGHENASGTATTTASVTDDQLQQLFKADAYSENFAKLGMKLYKKDFIDVKEEGFMEIIQSVDLFLDNFVGKQMRMSGFVYRESDMKDNQFVVARFGISCCSADATPFGVMVETPLAKNFPKDSWVQITGEIGKTKYGGNEIMKINATQIQKIDAPKSPYVYPNNEYYNNPNP